MREAAPRSGLEVLEAAGLYTLGEEPSPDAVEAMLGALIRSLEGSPELRVALCRDEVIRVLKGVGLQRPSAVVDAAFAAIRRPTETQSEGQGRAVALEDPEPWPDPVDGAELLDDLVRTFTRFVSLPEGAATLLVLWTLHAHAHAAAFVSPLLALVSPEKRCGKTTTLTLVGALVPRKLPASNISPAAIFRVVEAYRPTLLVDEADTFLKQNDELRGILNSGHTRATAVVVRTAGEDHEPRLFSTWAPKAVAMIGKLPGTLEDRSVVVQLRRQTMGEKKERLRLDRLDELEPLRQRAARWAADQLDTLRAADPAVPEGLHDRAADNWRPLLAIADAAGGPWPERARKAAARLGGAADDGDSPGPILLADARDLFDRQGSEWLSSTELVAELVKLEERPWSEWRRGNALTPSGLARLLKPFGVQPTQLRFGTASGDKVRGYERDAFQDAFSRYLPPSEAVHPVRSRIGAEKPYPSARYSGGPVPGSESGENPHPACDVPAVPVGIGKGGQEVMEL